MKTALALILTVTILSFTPIYVSEVNAAPPTDFVSCWDMEETSGTRVDYTANNNDLSANGTVTNGTGHVGTNGADIERANTESLSITDAAQTGLDITGDISIVGWINPDVTTSHLFVSKWDGTNGYFFRQNGGNLDFFYENANSRTRILADQANIFTSDIGNYLMVSVAVDVSAQTATIYVNATATSSTTVLSETTSIGDTTDAFFIGRESSLGLNMDGVADQWEIYNRIVSGAEMTELYNSGTGWDCARTGVGGAVTPTFKLHGLF